MRFLYYTATKYAVIAALGMLLGFAIGTGQANYHNDVNINRFRATHVSASSSLYQTERRNDLRYLHAIGNRKARLINAQAKRIDIRTQGIRAPGANYSGKWPIYHQDKYGNYWSYFRDHKATGNDLFDIGSSARSGMDISISPQMSGMIAQEQVLRNHGINSGPNFYHFDK